VNPTALVRIRLKERETWEEELIYEGMTNDELINRLAMLEVPRNAEIWADAEAPDRIEEIYRAGWHGIRPAQKGKQSVKDGIDFCLRFKTHVLRTSVNLIKELQLYKWQKDMHGNVLDQPVKFKDHLMDARRYAIFGHCQRQRIPHVYSLGG